MPPSISSALNREKKLSACALSAAIARRAHLFPKAVNVKQPTIFNRSILRAAVGVNDRPAFYQTAPPRSVKGINDQLRRHPLGNLPADNPAREFILKASQITPLSILQRQISDVADHHLSFARRLAGCFLQQIQRTSETVPRVGRPRHEAFRADRRQRLRFHQRTR